MTEITETPEELTVRQLIKGINEYAYDKLPPTKLKKDEYVQIYKKFVTPLKGQKPNDWSSRLKNISAEKSPECVNKYNSSLNSTPLHSALHDDYLIKKRSLEFPVEKISSINNLRRGKVTTYKVDRQVRKFSKFFLLFWILLLVILFAVYINTSENPTKEVGKPQWQDFVFKILKNQRGAHNCDPGNSYKVSFEELKYKFAKKFEGSSEFLLLKTLLQLENNPHTKIEGNPRDGYYTNADYFPVLCRLKKITAATISFTIRAFIGTLLFILSLLVIINIINRRKAKLEEFRGNVQDLHQKIMKKLRSKKRYEVSKLRLEVIEGPQFLPYIEDKSERELLWKAAKSLVQNDQLHVSEYTVDDMGIAKIVWEYNEDDDELDYSLYPSL